MEERIRQFKSDISSLQNEATRLSATAEQLNARLLEVTDAMSAIGVSPDNIEAEIHRLQSEFESLASQLSLAIDNIKHGNFAGQQPSTQVSLPQPEAPLPNTQPSQVNIDSLLNDI